MKIKTTREKLMFMLDSLQNIGKLKGYKLAYAVAKNKRALMAEQALLAEVIKPSEAHMEYEKERKVLNEKHAKKDDKGQPLIVMIRPGVSQYVGCKGNPEWEKEFEALNKKHEDAINEHKEKVDGYNNLLTEDFEFEMHMVTSEDLPTDISVEEMDAIWLMIQDK